MRYPNLRYGNPTEMQHYAMGVPLATLARNLRRDERTVRDWLTGRARVPWWVPEVLRLQRMEMLDMQRQMFANLDRDKRHGRLGVVTHAGQLELRRPDVKKPQPITVLRLDDFSTIVEPTSSVS